MIYQKLRTRVLILVVFLTLALFFFISYNNYKEKEEVLYNVSIEKLLILTKVMHTYEKKQLHIYESRFKNLENSSSFRRAIRSNNLSTVRSYARSLKKSYQDFTPDLEYVNIYNQKGYYLFDSKKKIKSKKIASINNDVLQEALKKKEITIGYVAIGSSNYYYSIIKPIYRYKKIIAYVEFGLKAENLFKIISKAGQYRYALYLNTSETKSTKRLAGKIIASNSKIFTDLKINQDFIYKNANNNKIIYYNDKAYLFHQYDIESPFQKNFAQVLMAKDVTKYIRANQETSIKTFLISFGVLLFVYIGIYILFTKLINILLKEEEEIRIKQDQMQVIMDNSNDLITLFHNGELVLANNTMLTFTGLKDLESLLVENKNIGHFFEEDEDTFSAKESRTNREWIHKLSSLKEERRVVTIKSKRFGLNYFNVKTKVVPQQPNSIIVIFSNISSIFKKSKKDEYMAYHDQLTNVYNRQFFHQAVEKGIYEASKNHKTSSMIMFDLDFFKKVNDTYGHQVGDEVLIKFAEVISKNIRAKDTFARWGGEEFVLLLCETDKNGALKVANNLVRIVADTVFETVGKVTCSIGLSEFQKDDNIESWMTRADEALYRAKENGRNRAEVA
jgi:diguanylate cyclase (GGDEF)-like protein